jgi:Helix-turn-helix domain
MTVIQMSGQELTRLRIMIDLADGRITVEATAALMGLGRRQVFRLRRWRTIGREDQPALTKQLQPKIPTEGTQGRSKQQTKS